MAEEKKYEITISDLSAYIGAAAFEILPEDAKEEDVNKYATAMWNPFTTIMRRQCSVIPSEMQWKRDFLG